MKKLVGVCILPCLLTACVNGKESVKIEALQKKDKNLSCKEILLEMNEAEFYRDAAYKNRGLKLKNVLMPMGYISTYMNADEAIDAAEARVTYLDRIYQIMRCGDKEGEEMTKLPDRTSSLEPSQRYSEERQAPAPVAEEEDQESREFIGALPEEDVQHGSYEASVDDYLNDPRPAPQRSVTQRAVPQRVMPQRAAELPVSPYQGGAYADAGQMELPVSPYPGGSTPVASNNYYRALPGYTMEEQYATPRVYYPYVRY